MIVHVENVNEAPLFHVTLYTAEVFSVATPTFPVVQVKVKLKQIQLYKAFGSFLLLQCVSCF